jgi:hypothetical protein
VVLARNIPPGQSLKDSEAALRGCLRKLHLHVRGRILEYLEIVLRFALSGLPVRRRRSVDINRLSVPLQGRFVIVARRAQKTGDLISPVVERMQCVCWRNQGVPRPAPCPLFLTLLINA